ncbi:adenylate/guanylate cyclase domain protein (macronuclear) [Tetrahymena thermophila SB210]|uniref:Adenylate/guanylate cyclase domain protein n=1 Tax=Tetrahymena thermophila (strain SB210) TaxID=312017 RepID=I7M9S2_TETTS|nr:adenylate/guanylate cyclase domain protein [Tetrahymena thermophila SB210]EAS02708.2 adenylate/guanylate cyclase domain protein [Tetrahymena thermophila SB210]|eukprot:XP_001022953.2 adenylate/guanylate cyclase domain protein [Tetrahymena thermophila SB210]
MFKGQQSNEFRCPKCSQEEEKKLTIDIKRGRMVNHSSDKSNKISTRLYTKFSFLPITLIQFFKKTGNLFFLAVSLVMLIRNSLSPFKSWILISPLIFYLIVFILKEGYYEYLRYQSDKCWNDRKCIRGFLEDVQVLKKKKNEIKQLQKELTKHNTLSKTETLKNPNANQVGFLRSATAAVHQKQTDVSHVEEVKWADVQVGDILRVQHGEYAPADMILLDSNFIRDKLPVCYINTMQTDGKECSREVKASILTRISQVKDPKKSYFNKYKTKLNLKLIYETPNPNLEQFYGNMRLKKDPKEEELTIQNFIPRGCKIEMNKDKDWIFGLVVYTGMDTKIMLNKPKKTSKYSHIEKITNYYFLANICFIAILAIISMIVIVAKSKDIAFLLKVEPTISDSIRFFTYIILYSQMIPLSVYFILDVVQLGSSFMTEKRMKQASVNKFDFFKIKNSDSLCNLGQIDYIFMDKIGVPFQGEKKICQLLLQQDDYIFNPKELKQELVEKDWNKIKDTKYTQQSPVATKTNFNNNDFKDIEANKVDTTNMQLNNNFNFTQKNEISFNQLNTDRDRPQEKLESIPSEHNIGSEKRDVKSGKPIDNQIVFSRDKLYSFEYLQNKQDEKLQQNGENVKKYDEYEANDEINFIKADSIKKTESPLQVPQKPEDFTSAIEKESKLSKKSQSVQNQKEITQFQQKQQLKQEDGTQTQKANQEQDKTKRLFNSLNNNNNTTSSSQSNLTPLNKLGTANSSNQALSKIGLSYDKSAIDPSKINRNYTTQKFVQKIQDLSSLPEDLVSLDPVSQLMIAMLSCNNVQLSTLANLEKQTVNEASSPFDDQIIQFTQKSGFIMKRDENNFYINAFGKQILKITEKMINYPRQEKKIFSTVVKIEGEQSLNFRESKYYIYCRGEANIIRNKLWQIDDSYFDSISTVFKKRGVQPIIFARRQLQGEELAKFLSAYKGFKSDPQIQEEEMKQLGIEFEHTLEYIGTIGLIDQIDPKSQQLFQFIQQANINTYLLSYENVDSTFNTAINLSLTDGQGKNANKEYFCISEEGVDEIWSQTRSILNELKEKFSKKETKLFSVTNIHGDQKEIHNTNPNLDGEKKPTGTLAQIEEEKDHLQNKRNSDSNPEGDKKAQQSPEYAGAKMSSDDQIKKSFNQIPADNKLDPEQLKIIKGISLKKYESDKRQQKYQLQLNGNSLQKILRDINLLQHFAFILQFCKVVIGYNMSPYLKGELVKVVQNYMQFNPTVCAIGDGYKDTDMMRQADISIELVHQKDIAGQSPSSPNKQVENLIYSNTGDIQLSNIEQIYDLILVEGTNTYFKLQNLIFFMFYKCLLFGLPLFYFNWYCAFTGTSLFESLWVFLYQFLFNFITVFTYGIFERPFSTVVLKTFPSLYVSGQVEKDRVFSNYIVKCLIEGIIQGTIIYYVSIYIVSRSVSKFGEVSDFGMISLVTIYSIILVFNFRVIFTSNTYLTWIGQAFAIIFVVCFIFANGSQTFSVYNWVVVTDQIFKRGDSFCAIIFNCITCIIVSHFFNLFIIEVFFPNVYQAMGQKIQEDEENDWRVLTNETVLECSLNRKIDFSILIKKVFSKSSTIEPSVRDMINASDSDLSEMQMHRWSLKFQDEKHEVKYKYERTQSSSQTFRLVYILNMLPMAIYVLIDSLTDKSLDQIVGFIRAGFVIFFFLCTILVLHQSFQNKYYSFSFFLLLLGVICKIVLDWIQTEFSIAMTTVIATCLLTFNFNLGTIHTLFLNLLNSVNFIIRIVVLYYAEGYNKVNVNDNSQSDKTTLRKFFAIASFIIMVVYVFLISVYVYYKSEREKRKYFISQQTIKIQKTENDNLLSILVPKFVQNKLNSGKFEMADDQDEVAILFADVCDMDEIMEKEGNNIVYLIDDLFRAFDFICEKHGAQKIETVGKTYMAATGIIECEVDLDNNLKQKGKGVRLLNMAKEMIDVAQNKKYGNGYKSFCLKIGINKGKVMAGVIGNPKPQFSLIGDTVNTTSRICAESKPNEILVSESIKEEVKSMKFKLVPHKFTPKGKAELCAYFIKDLQTSAIFHSALGKINRNKLLASANNQMAPRHSLTNTGAGQTLAQKQNNVVNLIFKSVQTPKAKVTALKTQKSKQLDNIPSSRQNGANAENGSKPGSQKNINVDQVVINGVEEHHTQQNNLETIYDDDYDSDSDFDENEFSGEGDLKYNGLLMIKQSVSDETVFKFKDNIKKDNIKSNKIMVLLLILLYFMSTLILITVKDIIDNSSAIFVLRAIFCGALIIIVVIQPLAYSMQIYKYLMFGLFLYGIVPTFIQADFSDYEDLIIIQIIEMHCIFTTVSYLCAFQFIDVVIYSLAQSCLFIGLVWNYLNLSYCFFFFTYIAFILQKSYSNLRSQYKSFNFLSKISSKKNRMKELVDQLLPAVALNKMRNQGNFSDKKGLTDCFDDVTVLFADIKGFTEFSDKVVDPKKVLLMLKNLFESFDGLCVKHQVFKLYTIGDCYVVLSFITAERQDTIAEKIEEAKKVINMGLDMIETINIIKGTAYPFLNMRIGIHTGKIIGGIMGTDVVRYDVYGKDVMIANKMESNGEPGKVMISESTKQMLEKGEVNEYNITEGNEVSVKGRNEPIKGYFITKKTDQL